MSRLSGFVGVDDTPEMIAFCVEHCPHKSCKYGACEEYIAEYRRRHPRSPNRPGGRTPMLYEAFGQRMTIVEWGRVTGIAPKKLRGTMYYKRITLEEAIRIHAQIMGEVQTEVLTRLIAERFGVDASFEDGRILYRETIAEAVESCTTPASRMR